MGNWFNQILIQQLVLTPVLLTYVAGIVVALVYWPRCPRPALFSLIGIALLLISTVTQSFLSNYLVRTQREFGWSSIQFGWVMAANGLVWSAIRATAFGLLLTAVFIDRRKA